MATPLNFSAVLGGGFAADLPPPDFKRLPNLGSENSTREASIRPLKAKPVLYAQAQPVAQPDSLFGTPLISIQGVVTTGTLVEKALKDNPELRLAVISAANSQLLLDGQKGSNYVKAADVTLSTDALFTNSDNLLKAIPSIPTVTSGWSAQIAISDPKMAATIKTRDAAARFDALQLNVVRASIVERVLSGYANAQKFSLQVEKLTLQRSTAQKVLKEAELLKSANKLNEISFNNLLSQIDKLNSDLFTAQESLRIARANLALLTGVNVKPENLLPVNPQKLWTIDEDLEAKLGTLKTEEAYLQVIEQSVQANNLDVQLALQVITLAQCVLEEMQAATKPKVSAGFSFLKFLGNVAKRLLGFAVSPFGFVGDFLGSLFARVQAQDGIDPQQAIKKAIGDLKTAKGKLLVLTQNARVNIESPLGRVLKAAPSVPADDKLYSYHAWSKTLRGQQKQLNSSFAYQSEDFQNNKYNGDVVALFTQWLVLSNNAYKIAELAMDFQAQVARGYYTLGLIRPGDPNAIDLPKKFDAHPGPGVQVPGFPL